MRYLQRAFSDAFEGQLARTIVLALIGLGVGFLAFRGHYGSERAQLELPGLLIGLAMSLIPLLALFLWSLLCAPYRIERDKRLEAEKQNADLREALKQNTEKRSLTGEEKGVITDAIRQSGVKPNQLNVLFDNADPWCADFACEISEAVEGANIVSQAHDGIMLGRNPRDRGLKIYAGSLPVIQKLSDDLHAAFKTIGINAERRETKTDSNIFIDVCRFD